MTATSRWSPSRRRWSASTRRSGSRCTSSSTPRRRCSAAARPSSAPSPTPRSARPASGLPGRDAGGQRQGRRVGDPDRAGAQLRDRRVVPVRAEELLLPGHAEELPDLAVRRADRVRRLDRGRGRRARRTGSSIERAHMEEDTGKSLHVGGATGRIHGADYSLVDYNRAGIPLIEIVTKPITGTGAAAPLVARAYVAQLRDLLLGARRLRRADGAGLAALRRQPVAGADGVRRCSAPAPRPRTSTRCARSSGRCATRCSGTRRSCPAGDTILQETRHWHEDTGVTTSGREKSDAEDYRYFPEPDLVPVAPSREWVEELRAALPEPPVQAPGPAAGRLGLLRPRDARHRRRRRPRAGRGRPSRPAPRRRRPASGGSPTWPGAPTTPGSTSPTSGVTPAQVAEVQALVDDGHAQRQARPPGLRGPARR